MYTLILKSWMVSIVICYVTVESPQPTGNENCQSSDTDGINISVVAIAVLSVLLVVSVICIIILLIIVCKLKIQHQAPDKNDR